MSRYRPRLLLQGVGGAVVGVLAVAAIGGWQAVAVLATALTIVTTSMWLEDRRRARR